MTTDKHNKRPNVPPLRFPEFSGEWERSKLGYLTTKVGSGSTPRGGNSVYIERGHCFVRSQNVGMGVLLLDDIAHIDDNTHKKQIATEIKENDVLLNITGASIGRTAVATYLIAGGNVNQHVCIIRTNDLLNHNYLCNYIQTKKIQNYIYSLQTGGSREGLNFEQVRSFPICYPSEIEQIKISHLISLLDRRIATQSGLINKLESLISGITLCIVKSNNCESIHLSELLTERNEVNTAQYEVYSISVSQGVVNQVDYLGRSFAAKDTSNYNVVHYGDIVYTKSPTGDFPYGIVKRSNQANSVAVSPLYGVYIPASNDIGCFLHYYFCNAASTKNYLHKLIQKGAKNTINITNQRFLENTIKLPNAERLAIVVKLLNQLSVKKQRAEELLALYRKQKQYLLSQMFI
jgi:type I restriction enzyme S subunit